MKKHIPPSYEEQNSIALKEIIPFMNQLFSRHDLSRIGIAGALITYAYSLIRHDLAKEEGMDAFKVMANRSFKMVENKRQRTLQ